MTREAALKIYAKKPTVEDGLIDYTKKRLGLNDEEFEKIMKEKASHWSDYKTYKKRFELFRPLFAILAKSNLVPTSFYLKYCFPVKIK